MLSYMPTVDSDGVAIAYEERGPRDADTVIFVEGLAYGRWMWRWQADTLADDYHVVLFDNRGTGESDAPDGPYTIPEMAVDLDAVLDAVIDAPNETVHVVGASMGGMIAMQYALESDRVASLSLFCTSHGGPDAVPIPEETTARMFGVPDDAGPREAIRYKMRPAVAEAFWDANQDVIEQIVDWRLDSDASDAARQAQAAGVQAFDVQDRLHEISTPTLVIHGTADRVLPAENGGQVADGIPDAEFVPIEDAGHLFFIERAAIVNDHLQDFHDDVGGGR